MTTSMPRSAGTADRIDHRTWQLCWVIVLGAFASGLDASIVNVGLASINHDLHASLSITQWVTSAYLLALAVSLPLAGWLARQYGSGRIWLVSLAGFTVASLACAVAPTVELLIAARVVQGLAGGVLIPTGQTILGQRVGPERLGRVMGTLGIAVSAAPAMGSLLGGLILHALPWPWLFLVNVPIGTAGLLLGGRLVPRGAPAPAGTLHRSGLVLISVGLPALVFAITRWGDSGALTTDTLVAAGLAVAALTAFVTTSRATDHPLLNLTLYQQPAFRAGSVTAFFSGGLVFGSGVVHALYFQLGRGQDPLRAGISILGVAGATAAAAPLTGRWIDRHGPSRAALTGGLLAMTTTAPLTLLPLDTPMMVIQPLLIAYGAAVSLVAMPAGVTAYRAVTVTQLPDAITQINILQRIGGSLGGAICAVLIATRQSAPSDGFRLAFLALLLSATGATAGAWLIHRSTRSRGHVRRKG
ncbi:DHA2 family efflux MFS transporter permease subunit [Streptomyces sp. NPDC050560]|uniref:DHA2 family efflux MFS transporter permease subunit n=1 Tax=Streptomyces sp. NPDC050560 TaxID=3365630 RepID=UPI00379B9D5C